MREIPINTLEDLTNFVEVEMPSKEQLALIIQKKYRLLTFTENFQTSTEILQELTRVLRQGPRPIWLGARLEVETSTNP
jgi:hypothetical protein